MEHQSDVTAGEPCYEVFSPLGRPTAEPIPVNPAAESLNGKTIGELLAMGFKGEQMFPIFREELRKRFPEVRFVQYEVFGHTHGQNEAQIVESLPELLKKHGCDAVISGVGA